MTTLKYNWFSLNNKISVRETKKRFYNRFCFSVEYFCPGGRCLSSSLSESDIKAALELRTSLAVYNYAGSWRAKKTQFELFEVSNLANMLKVKLDNPDNIKFRVEEPHIQIYAETEGLLYQIASGDLSAQKCNLRRVTAPKDQDTLELLNSGSILLTKSNGYLYKIILKDGKYANGNKAAIRNYLINLGDVIKMSPSVLRNLSTTYDHAWNIWFYSNDKNIVAMIELIEPGCVTNIHMVVDSQ